MNGNSPTPGQNGPRRRRGRSGLRQWFRITGLPGWKRAQLGIPAFGDPQCVPRIGPDAAQLPVVVTRCNPGTN